jgi:hypothetical protein
MKLARKSITRDAYHYPFSNLKGLLQQSSMSTMENVERASHRD